MVINKKDGFPLVTSGVKKNNENLVKKYLEENFLENQEASCLEEESEYKIIMGKLNNAIGNIEKLEKISVNEIKLEIKELIDKYFTKLPFVDQFKLITDSNFLYRIDFLEKKVEDEINVKFAMGYSSRLRDLFLKEIELQSANELVQFIAWTKTDYFSMYEAMGNYDNYDYIADIREEFVIPEVISDNDWVEYISNDYFYVKKNDNSKECFFRNIPKGLNGDDVKTVSLKDIILDLNNSEEYLEILDILNYFYSTPEILTYVNDILKTDLLSLEMKDQLSFFKFLINNNIEDVGDRIESILNNNPAEYEDTITEWSDENGNWKKVLKNKEGEIIWRGESINGHGFELWSGAQAHSDINQKSFFKTFLSTSDDSIFGENILKIGENFEPEVANLIFEKYSEIVDSVGDVEKILIESMGGEEEIDKTVIQKIKEDLLQRGKKLLNNFSQNTEVSEEDVFEELDKIKSNILLFNSMVLSLKSDGLISNIDELINVEVEEYQGRELKKESIFLEQVLEIYKETLPERYDIAFLKFKDFIEKEKTRVFTIEKKENDNKNLLAFMMAVEQENGTVNLRALNISKEYGTAYPGTSLLGGIIDEYKKEGKVLEIEAEPRQAIAYMNKYGFVIDGIYSTDDGKEFLTLSLGNDFDISETEEIVVDKKDDIIGVLKSYGLGDGLNIKSAKNRGGNMIFEIPVSVEKVA